jgi:hypothetical protein
MIGGLGYRDRCCLLPCPPRIACVHVGSPSPRVSSSWFAAFEQFQAAIDDCLNKMATDHKQEAASLFVHQFQRFEDVPILAA